MTEIPSTDIYLMPKEHFMQWYNENGFTVNDREKHERILKEVKKRGKALLKNTELNLKTGRIIKYANQKNVKKHS